ncbi:hypothetical protein QFZ60_001631 [Arthrobacter sp. B2I5]|jgi:hypothetical protein|uniref:hypothetical protein n=1 Tax=Arthrobacter sp. B2I5 TaxID=3042266 RepID=UPI002784A5EF|nr:hypothetical protein [Arthrobacter sp. B2I5]MDQ0825458.1 hypothetical protein [Arthrobacter sp. B2I5]
MEHVIVRTDNSGRPTAVLSRGREWSVGAEPVRWFERINWWETSRRMPKGNSGVDVEVLQLQVRLGNNSKSALTTLYLERGGAGGGWRLRETAAGAA